MKDKEKYFWIQMNVKNDVEWKQGINEESLKKEGEEANWKGEKRI